MISKSPVPHSTIVTGLSNALTKSGLTNMIDSLITGALPYYNSVLKKMYYNNQENAKLICDFIMAEFETQNIKMDTRLTHIKVLGVHPDISIVSSESTF